MCADNRAVTLARHWTGDCISQSVFIQGKAGDQKNFSEDYSVKGCYRINLRIWLPTFICVVLVGVFSAWLVVHYNDLRKEHRAEHMANWRAVLGRIQPVRRNICRKRGESRAFF